MKKRRLPEEPNPEFDNLPDEIVQSILGFLPYRDIVALMRSTQYLERRISALANDRAVWQNVDVGQLARSGAPPPKRFLDGLRKRRGAASYCQRFSRTIHGTDSWDAWVPVIANMTHLEVLSLDVVHDPDHPPQDNAFAFAAIVGALPQLRRLELSADDDFIDARAIRMIGVITRARVALVGAAVRTGGVDGGHMYWGGPDMETAAAIAVLVSVLREPNPLLRMISMAAVGAAEQAIREMRTAARRAGDTASNIANAFIETAFDPVDHARVYDATDMRLAHLVIGGDREAVLRDLCILAGLHAGCRALMDVTGHTAVHAMALCGMDPFAALGDARLLAAQIDRVASAPVSNVEALAARYTLPAICLAADAVDATADRVSADRLRRRQIVRTAVAFPALRELEITAGSPTTIDTLLRMCPPLTHLYIGVRGIPSAMPIAGFNMHASTLTSLGVSVFVPLLERDDLPACPRVARLAIAYESVDPANIPELMTKFPSVATLAVPAHDYGLVDACVALPPKISFEMWCPVFDDLREYFTDRSHVPLEFWARVRTMYIGNMNAAAAWECPVMKYIGRVSHDGIPVAESRTGLTETGLRDALAHMFRRNGVVPCLPPAEMAPVTVCAGVITVTFALGGQEFPAPVLAARLWAAGGGGPIKKTIFVNTTPLLVTPTTEPK
ncbi:MAG: hypothetical protein WC732_08535 [Candidatus Omnitrophota bacterium]